LETIRKEPLCERRRLLEVLEPAALLPDADPAKVTEAKTRLASDLHWLLHAGHVLEFHTGRFDLPLEKRQDTHNADAGSESAEDHEDSSLEPPKAEAAIIVHEATSEQEPESPAAPAEIETSPLDHENAPASTVPEAPLENLKISEPNAIESDPVETPNPAEPAHQQAQQ